MLKDFLQVDCLYKEHARVVWKVDNAIHGINHYPADSMVCFVNTYPLDSDLSGGGSVNLAFEQLEPEGLHKNVVNGRCLCNPSHRFWKIFQLWLTIENHKLALMYTAGGL